MKRRHVHAKAASGAPPVHVWDPWCTNLTTGEAKGQQVHICPRTGEHAWKGDGSRFEVALNLHQPCDIISRYKPKPLKDCRQVVAGDGRHGLEERLPSTPSVKPPLPLRLKLLLHHF